MAKNTAQVPTKQVPTKLTAQDEILYCARCGISFLWSQEEQRQAQAGEARAGDVEPVTPLYCAGCRLLLPAAGRERGQVKWYNGRKQYGFITRAAHPDIYVHRSGVASGRLLREGDLVEFAVEQTDRGPAASDVHVLEQENT